MKIKLFCIFLFALTAEIAAANINSISTINIDNFTIVNKDSIALYNPNMKVLQDDTYYQNQSEFRFLISLSNIKWSINNR